MVCVDHRVERRSGDGNAGKAVVDELRVSVVAHGDIEDDGLGVEGFKHLRIAAGLWNADAQGLLASMYRAGDGVARNDELAFFWQNKRRCGDTHVISDSSA
jgi:hypothetical protein